MRRSSLTLAVLLMGIFLANVVVAGETDLLLQLTSPTANMTEATVDCEANVLPWETRALSPEATGGMCGCGATLCVGESAGTPCLGEESACMQTQYVCSSNPSTWACVCYVWGT